MSVTAVLIVVIALAVDGPDYEGTVNGGTGYWGEPANQPLQMRLGPNPGATMNQQFESVLNVAFGKYICIYKVHIRHKLTSYPHPQPTQATKPS